MFVMRSSEDYSAGRRGRARPPCVCDGRHERSAGIEPRWYRHQVRVRVWDQGVGLQAVEGTGRLRTAVGGAGIPAARVGDVALREVAARQ
jgi:hypothetical protein